MDLAVCHANHAVQHSGRLKKKQFHVRKKVTAKTTYRVDVLCAPIKKSTSMVRAMRFVIVIFGHRQHFIGMVEVINHDVADSSRGCFSYTERWMSWF